ncbi:MAG: alpha-amylase family glycosyl hydrolase [Lentisphaerales bacterium]|nr:alpha-amylase family glycosyl hydrolase [Lentisphaerales bacterium]
MCLSEIIALIDQYSEEITPKPHVESEKDIILISYGDHVYSESEKPLKTLKTFLDDHCQKSINSVHILPFYPYTSDDGFSVVNYVAVDETLGTWNEVKEIGYDYRLMCDAVVNHMSSKSEWFLGYLKGDKKYKEYFVDVDPSIDLSMVVRPRTSPLLTPFKSADGTTKNIWTTFSADQVDLNYANYKVLIEVLNVLFTYVKNGATLVRLDAIAFLWKEPGSPSVHLPQTHEIIQLMREVLHQVSPEVIIITETNVPHKENISYFGSGHDEAQMVYNFP